jgi:hypothetical protein
MTFGRNQDPKIEGSKGGSKESDIRSFRLSDMMKSRWKNPEFRMKQTERLRSYNKSRTKSSFVEMGKKSRFYENIVAEKIRESYDFLFKPSDVCDRIGIKNGKITFIEIKNRLNKCNSRLTRSQRVFRSIAKDRYLIQYYP